MATIAALLNAAALANIKTHLAGKALPRYGRRSYLVTAYNGALAGATTIANGLNYRRIVCQTSNYRRINSSGFIRNGGGFSLH